MDKAIEEIFKVFSHLGREIQVYIFTGFIILLNLYLLDCFYYNSHLWNGVKNHQLFIPGIIILSYIIGQFCLAFYNLVLEIPKIDIFLYEKIFKNRFNDIKCATDESMVVDKVEAMKKHKELYFHFIERNVNLSMMRWNFSSAFLIITLTNFSYCIFIKSFWQIMLISVLTFFASACFFVLSVYTQKENIEQIKEIKKLQ